MSNPRIGQAKMMCSMWHLLTFHDVSSGVVCFLFPRPPRLHCFEFDLNDGKLLGRRQMPLEDQWLGAFLCCKLHMGGLRRILLNPQLRQRGWILSPATSYKKFATLHLKRYGSCHRIFTLLIHAGGMDVPVDMPTFHPLRDGKEADSLFLFYFRLVCSVPVCL